MTLQAASTAGMSVSNRTWSIWLDQVPCASRLCGDVNAQGPGWFGLPSGQSGR
jgi:hypothetical protein